MIPNKASLCCGRRAAREAAGTYREDVYGMSNVCIRFVAETFDILSDDQHLTHVDAWYTTYCSRLAFTATAGHRWRGIRDLSSQVETLKKAYQNTLLRDICNVSFGQRDEAYKRRQHGCGFAVVDRALVQPWQAPLRKKPSCCILWRWPALEPPHLSTSCLNQSNMLVPTAQCQLCSFPTCTSQRNV